VTAGAQGYAVVLYIDSLLGSCTIVGGHCASACLQALLDMSGMANQARVAQLTPMECASQLRLFATQVRGGSAQRGQW
jgi:hypothetical protein